MTLSRQASYDTFVFEKSHEAASLDIVQLLGETSGLRKELDIGGLSEGVDKVWSNLKQFQSPTSWLVNLSDFNIQKLNISAASATQ